MLGKRFCQTAKLALSLDLVTKFLQHNHFRHFRHHFGSTFPRNPTKPMFRCLPTPPLMRWRFQHTCRWIWRFRGCHSLRTKEKKPNNWLQKTFSVWKKKHSTNANKYPHLQALNYLKYRTIALSGQTKVGLFYHKRNCFNGINGKWLSRLLYMYECVEVSVWPLASWISSV